MKQLHCLLLGLLLLPAFATAKPADDLIRREWTVDGLKREALIHLPEPASVPAPVVFVFHGHGGSMRQVSTSSPFHRLWPEAIVVYMQGLPTAGQLTDPQGERNGWQARPGDQDDRDLKFFDAVWASLRHDYEVDEKRIYSTGHSNGGGFTYLLWATRPEVFAAFGPSAAVLSRGSPKLTPAPVIHIAGENDGLVKYSWQKLMIDSLLRTNQCDQTGQVISKGLTLYESKLAAPVQTYIHPGTHQYPSEASALIVDFFKAHSKP